MPFGNAGYLGFGQQIDHANTDGVRFRNGGIGVDVVIDVDLRLGELDADLGVGSFNLKDRIVFLMTGRQEGPDAAIQDFYPGFPSALRRLQQQVQVEFCFFINPDFAALRER